MAVDYTTILAALGQTLRVVREGAGPLQPGQLVRLHLEPKTLDLKVPVNTPGWIAKSVTAVVRNFASIDEWIMRHPWDTIRDAVTEELADASWTELFFGTAFLVAGSKGTGTSR